MKSFDLAQRIAEALLKNSAVKVSLKQPFKWTSGIVSPIYCDNRKMISFVQARELIVNGFVDCLNEIDGLNCVAGTATAAIPWASFVAQKMRLPMVYVRPEPKAHGAGKQIEGDLAGIKKVVLIEDLISTGGSSLKAVEALRREAEVEVLGVYSIMNYELPVARENFFAAGLKEFSLTNFSVLIEVAVKYGIINEIEKERILEFIEDPEGWGIGKW